MPSPGRSRIQPGSKLTHSLPPVLCVDLDGTLVATDTLWESLLSILVHRPLAIVRVLAALTRGKAQFKASVARYALPRVDRLPYRTDLLRYLEEQKLAGRRLVLVTAAHDSVAEAVAAHLGLFDDVVATTDGQNLRGRAKGALLREKFPGLEFSYAGNETADLDVWEHAAAAIPVGASPRVIRRIPVTIEATFPGARRTLKSLASAARVHQWIKNLLVFLPLFTSHDLHNWPRVEEGLLAFLALCFTASAQYVINDLIDLDSDRAHPTRKRRALASGDLPIPVGLVLAPVLLAAAGWIGYIADSGLLVTLLAAYFVSSLLYSTILKAKPLLDVFTLAGLYTFRIVIGGLVTEHPVSLWLLTFSFLFFLSLGFLKRYIEVLRIDGEPGEAAARAAYQAGESLILMAMGLGSGFASTVVLALYVNSETANQLYVQPVALWGFVPIGLLVQCRLWLAGSRGEIEEDPVRYVISDPMMWVGFAAGVAAYLLAIGMAR